MNDTQITRAVIEEFYSEALLLADEARAVFDLKASEIDGIERDEVGIALSIEGLKTTTRIMHVLAWLLNQRAWIEGELSERQMRNFGALPKDRPSDEAMMRQLLPETRALIRDTERLHARAARLDRARMDALQSNASPVAEMRGRIAAAFKAG